MLVLQERTQIDDDYDEEPTEIRLVATLAVE